MENISPKLEIEMTGPWVICVRRAEGVFLSSLDRLISQDVLGREEDPRPHFFHQAGKIDYCFTMADAIYTVFCSRRSFVSGE